MTEEIIERSDPHKGQFSPSSIKDYLRCRRSWYLSKGMGLRSKTESSSLGFGTTMHRGIETFYLVRSLPIEETKERYPQIITDDPHLAAKIAAAVDIKECWEKEGLESAVHSLENALILMDRYADFYHEDPIDFGVGELESTVHLPMPNGTTMFMRIDRVRRQGETIGVVDSKTTKGSLTDWYFQNFENDFALSCYFYAVEQILGRCDFVQIDAIKVPPPVRRGNIGFARRTFMRTDLQMSDFLNTYSRVTDEIMTGLKIKDEEERLRHFYTVPTGCADYGGCKYLGVCQHGLSHPSIKVDFELSK